MDEITIKYLTVNEVEKIDVIYKLMNKFSGEVGFVIKNSLFQSAERNELVYLQVNNQIVSVCNFHKRRDFITTIYEIVTDLEYRQKGFAKAIIKHLISNGHTIMLKCPADNESNGFYQKIGAKLIGSQSNRLKTLNIYKLTKTDIL